MKTQKILDLVSKYKTISMVGMDKNTGKTTTLNNIIAASRGKIPLGLTSIGRDGEKIDLVTTTHKPTIYIEKGTIVATAKNGLKNSDFTKEIIKTTNVTTPMGNVVICRALSDGYVDLAGPSITSDIKTITKELLDLNCKLVLIDGAINRKSLATPLVSEAVVLSTGAALNSDINKVVEQTLHTVNLFELNVEDDKKIINLSQNIFVNAKYGLINTSDYTYKCFNDIPTIDGLKNIYNGYIYIIVKGAVTDTIIDAFMKKINLNTKITLLVEDGTKIFISKNNFHKFLKRKGLIKVIRPIQLVCLTINPISPFGYSFDSNLFIEKLKEVIEFPIFDVVGGDYYH